MTGSKAASAAASGVGVNLEDISDDEAEEDTYEEDEDDSSSDLEEDDDSDTMVSTPARATPSSGAKKKKAVPNSSGKKKAAPAASVDDVTEKMSKMMSSAPAKKYDMNFRLPYMVTSYKHDDDNRCRVDIFARTLPQEFFKPDVVSDGNELQLRVQVPGFFYTTDRVHAANRAANFNVNTHLAQAFKENSEALDEDFGFPDQLFGDEPMTVKLPYKCEERILGWEIQAFPNESGTLTDDLGGQQFFIVVAIELQRAEKTKQRRQAGFRVFAAPADEAMG